MLMLIDKGYYDYDFEVVEKTVTFEDTIKTDEEVSEMASRFGFGAKKTKKLSEMTAEELQAHAMKEENQK